MPSHDDQTGGRLAWLDGKLLMTVGDHGYDGRTSPAVAQSADNAYGKVLLIDPAGGHEIFTMPRISAIRTFVMNHLIHHRGQLTVYLRLCDVPLPPVYGPTADVTGDVLAGQAHED